MNRVGLDFANLLVMFFYGQVTCGNCGTFHRIHRALRKKQLYRFLCHSCGAEVTFNIASVRWAFVPQAADPTRLKTLSSFSPPKRPSQNQDPVDTSQTVVAALPFNECSGTADPTCPSITLAEEDPPAEHRRIDTVIDQRPPVHLTPLLRQGMLIERESSRVVWLRNKQAVGEQAAGVGQPR